ncbi:uncharacterized protein EV420DRAFT_91654 [Desarmillaria tabescens]|uniref:Uncharacterized protein n=1 Tax=Armillaria tabescens TaxID=1929756 RepID=A0AA39NRE9_ARMTA|nr:uncharacterized protein EV420DRAFT_91654 [Desarmillaria tabescens]KAK0470138.1 hypothetical protein EV420DRAFT_91654 [Desarmillaria tabescens]
MQKHMGRPLETNSRPMLNKSLDSQRPFQGGHTPIRTYRRHGVILEIRSPNRLAGPALFAPKTVCFPRKTHHDIEDRPKTIRAHDIPQDFLPPLGLLSITQVKESFTDFEMLNRHQRLSTSKYKFVPSPLFEDLRETRGSGPYAGARSRLENQCDCCIRSTGCQPIESLRPSRNHVKLPNSTQLVLVHTSYQGRSGVCRLEVWTHDNGRHLRSGCISGSCKVNDPKRDPSKIPFNAQH